MAQTEREGTGAWQEVHHSSTSASASLEQISHPLCRTMERAHTSEHHAQALDRKPPSHGSSAASEAVIFPRNGTRSAQHWCKTAIAGTCTLLCRRSLPRLAKSRRYFAPIQRPACVQLT